jgi:hypothetical protein
MAATTPTSASTQTEALQELAAFPLVEALFGRRSRRFALGDEIPDSPLAYRSRRQPLPLSELERMLVLSAMGGTTGWHFSITRHARYAPHVSNYAGGAAGRTFPSAAGFHTAELFFTDDSGLYFFPTRDAGALIDPAIDQVTPELMVERHRFSMLGASGNPDVPGLGFRYDEDERWSTPNPTGRQGCSRPTARRTTPTWPRRWRPLPSTSSAQAARSTLTPQERGPTAPACGGAPRFTTSGSKRASRCRPSTSSTPSASSPAPCPRCSS